MVDCAWLGPARFVDPFFEQTITRTLWNPGQMLFRRQVPIAMLEEFARDCPGLPPTAFIFHLSRSGSTLVSQMLSALPRNLAISEAAPLDHVLCAEARYPGVTRAQRLGWVRAMISALGQPRHGETHFYLKLDSWHLLELPLLHEAFPEVPWIYLYRDPIDVLLSHHRQRGTQGIPGVLPPGVLHLDPPWAPPETLEEYTARVLAAICGAALQHAGLGRGRLVNYSELPEGLAGWCAGHFGVPYTADEWAIMRAATQFNAKEPGQHFVDETAERRRAAPPEVADLCKRWLAEPYARLEALRAAQPPLSDAS